MNRSRGKTNDFHGNDSCNLHARDKCVILTQTVLKQNTHKGFYFNSIDFSRRYLKRLLAVFRVVYRHVAVRHCATTETFAWPDNYMN